MNSVEAKHPIIICTLYFILFRSFTVKSVIPSLPSTCSLITRKQQKKGAESWIICVTVFYVLLMTTHNCAEGDFTVGLSTLKQEKVCPRWNGGAGRAALKPCDGQASFWDLSQLLKLFWCLEACACLVQKKFREWFFQYNQFYWGTLVDVTVIKHTHHFWIIGIADIEPFDKSKSHLLDFWPYIDMVSGTHSPLGFNLWTLFYLISFCGMLGFSIPHENKFLVLAFIGCFCFNNVAVWP